MRKKAVAPVPSESFPEYSCCHCWFFETNDADSGVCFGNPPQPVFDGETWGFGRPLVDPMDRGCHFFKPRHTA